MPEIDMILRLLAAALLGGIVGLERESKRRAAGLRTHLLVSMGSALVMITSQYVFYQYQGLAAIDPTRLGAQVISGIGFLGAGTIIKQGASVKGLTTAASLWAVACIGLAVGAGYYLAAVVAAVIVVLALFLLEKFEKSRIDQSRSNPDLVVRVVDAPGKLGEVAMTIGKTGANITNIELDKDDNGQILVRFSLHLPKDISKSDVTMMVMTLEGVSIVE